MKKWQRVNYLPNLPLGADGVKVTASKEHIDLSKNAAKEGMVLLKNDKGLLPLEKGAKIALFGKGCADFVKGGGGSGDVTVEYTRNLYEGFKVLSDHVSVYEPLADYYSDYVEEQYKAGKEPGMVAEPKLTDAFVKGARNFTDIGVITISRFSGEGWDRRSTLDTDHVYLSEGDRLNAEKASTLFEQGDFYLSNSEQEMVDQVLSAFDKVVVVLNVGGMVDTNWFIKAPSVQSVLMAWQGGMEGGLATAELLCGIGNPSGKLADTFAKNLEDYPSSYNFHESDNYVDYTEDIYVGYRYFETIPGAKEKVNYPFGYGLSYTDFDLVVKQVEDSGDEGFETITLKVSVTNVGECAGKEVVQVYVNPPQGLLQKPMKNLVAFKKTRLLKKGESEQLVLKFNAADMASYDDLGKVQKSAYVLEAGEYEIFVGTSVRNAVKQGVAYSLDKAVVTKQLSAKIVPTSLKKRMVATGEFEELPLSEANDPNENMFEPMSAKKTEGLMPEIRGQVGGYTEWSRPYDEHISFMDVYTGKMDLDDFIKELTLEELAHLLGGQPNTGVANTFGYGNLMSKDIPNIMTADGPAGLRIKEQCGINTTAWPCSTLLACSWDEAIVYEVGEAGAKEVKENNIGIWLTPAINIHRSPLCGRNFEYYSEDPYLTGKLAASMVRGIQSQRIGATVKHFALNNKETNRKNSDSRVSERAAREIYLKGFEMVVKEADPWLIMSGYNIINGHRASENRELLEDVLRNEWGFNGMVTTDWWTFGEHYKETNAGNDAKMGCGFKARLLKAVETGALTRETMEVSVKRILETLLKID